MAAEELRDITNIPYFAYEPGLATWLILLGCFATCYLLIKFFEKSGRKAKGEKALDKAAAELEALYRNANDRDAKSALFEASMIVRRLISHFEGEEAGSLGESELSRKMETSRNGVKPLLSAAIEIEKCKYRPGINSEDAQRLIKGSITSVYDAKQISRQEQKR